MINPATGSDDLGGTRASIGNVKLRLAPDDQPWEMGFAASRECTRATQDAYVGWNDIKGRKLSISDGSPDPYMRRCTDSQTLSGKYTTDDWVFNLISAPAAAALFAHLPFRFVNRQYASALESGCAGAARRNPRAMRVPLIWCLGCTGRTPARS